MFQLKTTYIKKITCMLKLIRQLTMISTGCFSNSLLTQHLTGTGILTLIDLLHNLVVCLQVGFEY